MKTKKIKYEVGETFKHKGVRLKVEEWYVCEECYFNRISTCHDMRCVPSNRSDHKSVIFRKIKKRPFSFYIIKTWKEFWNIKINNYNYGTKRFKSR